ncbi:MAG: NACHT domain-containing protein [Chloroflexota bacterium]
MNISGSVLESVQIGGIAGRDLNLTQIQGGIGAINVFGTVQIGQAPINSAQPLSQQEYRWRQVLLDKVKKFWIDGVLAKSLHTKVLIELGLEERSEYVHNPLREVEEFPSNSEQVFPDGTAAADIFEGIGAGRTLLILGEPGSGKTVTLLKLAESLIARAEDNLGQPLPVVLNLSSWAKQRKSIANWLVQELCEIYGTSKSLGKAWVDQEQLILLLDGLDEVDAKYRKDCVKALNQFIQEHGLTEMVVCSRIRDYESLTERLKLRSAICVQPLTSQQIDQFLEQTGASLSALRIAFRKDAELRNFASSPLILSIMSLTYQDCSAEGIFHTNKPENYRKQLFDTYIDRMLTRRRATQQYSSAQTLHWLIWLAQRMVNVSQSIFLIERLQPSWLLIPSQRVRYRIANILFFGSIFGVAVGLVFWLITGPATALLSGLSFGLIAGPLEGLFGNIETVETLRWSYQGTKKRLRNNLLLGLIIGLLFGLSSGVLFGPNSGLFRFIGWVFFWTIAGLIGGLMAGLIAGFRGPEIQQSSFPNQGIWQSAKNFLIIGLVSCLLFGLLFWLVAEFTTGWLGDGFIGGISSLLFGLSAGLIMGGSACVQHFILRLMLYSQGNAPLNYAHFLDYVTDRLFMQRVGGGYIFVHRMLLEHFAQMGLEPEQR